jgi:hypothetical protein
VLFNKINIDFKRNVMEVKEAIRRIRDHFRVHDDGRPTPYLDEAVHIVIKSTEKQIPMKLIKEFDDDVKTHWCRCPSCDIGLGWEHTKLPKYCPECGQKLEKC